MSDRVRQIGTRLADALWRIGRPGPYSPYRLPPPRRIAMVDAALHEVGEVLAESPTYGSLVVRATGPDWIEIGYDGRGRS